MKYDKAKYEQLILSSVLFQIDKEHKRTAYRVEALKMVEYLYCYLLSVNEEKNEPYGYEIVEIAKRCINGFDGRGNFLHYFNTAWKNEYSHICGEEIVSKKYKGLKLSEQEKRNIKKYMRLLSTRTGEILTNEDKYAKVAELMEISVEEVRKVVELTEVQVTGEVTYNYDGDEVSVFDQKADEFSIEAYFENLASLIGILDRIEETFSNLQERQKPIIADMLTIKIGFGIYEIEKIKKKYSFISENVRMIIKQTKKIPTQRDIADKYGKNEASISRTIKNFLLKLKKGD